MTGRRTDRLGAIRVAFVGRQSGKGQDSQPPQLADGARDALREARAALGGEGPAPEVVHCRQVHSAKVVRARRGPAPSMEADGLYIDDAGAALCVFTADCVPVLLASGSGILALHAGWRGLAADILARGVARLRRPGLATAWIGPSIGACCYEVSAEVALRVARRSGTSCVVHGTGPRPHLDLVRAARLQLSAAGVEDIRILRGCTYCDEGWHSYRREGAGRGRNHAFVWLEAQEGRAPETVQGA